MQSIIWDWSSKYDERLDQIWMCLNIRDSNNNDDIGFHNVWWGWRRCGGLGCGKTVSGAEEYFCQFETFLFFLLEPSPIIGNPCQQLTYWLADSCLVDLFDVTLACENAYSKLVDVVAVADVGDEDHVDNSLLQI